MLAVLVLSVASVGWTSPWMNTRDTPEVRAHKLVAEMTTTEKVRDFLMNTLPHDPTQIHILSQPARSSCRWRGSSELNFHTVDVGRITSNHFKLTSPRTTNTTHISDEPFPQQLRRVHRQCLSERTPWYVYACVSLPTPTPTPTPSPSPQ